MVFIVSLNGMRLQLKPNGQAVITIPDKLRKAKGWEDKEELEWRLNQDGALELRE
jgi:bifunctional DNA-binding transcriptional regulator/antitoxin component of YhaV-PrlF toxin-antitoxin module